MDHKHTMGYLLVIHTDRDSYWGFLMNLLVIISSFEWPLAVLSHRDRCSRTVAYNISGNTMPWNSGHWILCNNMQGVARSSKIHHSVSPLYTLWTHTLGYRLVGYICMYMYCHCVGFVFCGCFWHKYNKMHLKRCSCG